MTATAPITPRAVVLADSPADARNYLRTHPHADTSAYRLEDLAGLTIGMLYETATFARRTDPPAQHLRQSARARLDSPRPRATEVPFGPDEPLAPIAAGHTHARNRGVDDLAHRFSCHPATPDRAKAHQAIRDAHLTLAELLAEYVPAGREHSLAITNLEQSMMWANAGIARA